MIIAKTTRTSSIPLMLKLISASLKFISVSLKLISASLSDAQTLNRYV